MAQINFTLDVSFAAVVENMPSFRPINFTWVIDGLLSGCAFPSHGGHFQYLAEAGVRHLVTLTEFTPPLHLLPTGRLNYLGLWTNI